MKALFLSETGSTNVYQDLGYPDPEAMLRKAAMVAAIIRGINAARLNEAGAAELFGCDAVRVSQLARGQFRSVSEAELVDMLAKLDNHNCCS